jgi:hypothetical protein
MRKLGLTRSVDDRRRWEIVGIGWLRSAGWLSQRAAAGREPFTGAAGDWAFEPRGWTGGRAEALDPGTGLRLGGYRRTSVISHNGTVTWGGRDYELARTSSWRQHFRLSLDGEPAADLAVKSLGRTRVELTLTPLLEHEPGLVLFVCWLCQLFVAQDSAAA